MTGKTEPLFAGENDGGKRLDRVLRRHFPGLPLSGLYRLIRRGRVKVNRRRAAADFRLAPGDRIDVDLAAPSRDAPPAPPQAVPWRLRDLVIFRNEHVLALNKPYGALVHGPGSLDDLVNAEIGADGRSLSFRPGPAHRLDRNTTGVQLWSLSILGARELARLFAARRVKKVYCALVAGSLERRAEWEDRLERDRTRKMTVAAAGAGSAGVVAATSVLPVFSGGGCSLALFLPKTGRTHQLRFQAARRGHPLPGDRKYGGAADRPRYLLHSLGVRIDSDALALPPLVAPFDRFGRETVESLFGRGAVGAIYRRCREILDRP